MKIKQILEIYDTSIDKQEAIYELAKTYECKPKDILELLEINQRKTPILSKTGRKYIYDWVKTRELLKNGTSDEDIAKVLQTDEKHIRTWRLRNERRKSKCKHYHII